MMKIKRVTQFNFLCIVLRSNLKWNKHTDHISKKISRAIGVMYRLKQLKYYSIEFSESSRYVYMCCLELLLQTYE